MTSTTAEKKPDQNTLPGVADDKPPASTSSTGASGGAPPQQKRGRGRPPKNRGTPSGAPAAAAAAAPGPSPYGGAPVAGDGPGTIDLSNAPAAVRELAALPADQLAKVVLTVGEGVAIALAGMRYGPQIAQKVMGLEKQERELLEPLTAEWVKTALPKVTAGELLVVMLLVTIGQKVVVMEQHLDQEKEKKESRRPSKPPEKTTAEAAAERAAAPVV